MDSSEAGRILPNPRQRGRAGSGQSSEVNSAEKEESFHVKSNNFEFEVDVMPKANQHYASLDSKVVSLVGVGTSEKSAGQSMADVDFAMQFLNIPSTEASGLSSCSVVYSPSECTTMPCVFDDCSSTNATAHIGNV